jgi:formiminoglutamase
MKHFKFYSKEDILSLTKMRRFETRLGEQLQQVKEEAGWLERLHQSPAKYVVLGIPEDIGVLANKGIGGTATAWIPFLIAFVNTKSNDFLTGDNILLLGHFDFGDIKFLIDSYAYNPEELIEAYRHAVNIIDDEVEAMLKTITAAGKTPIVIGGGHNNAYPIIKGVAKGLAKNNIIPLAQINCVNLDAHADYGPAEGRHSGNPFRYAEEDGYLGKYCVVGVQENNMSQNVLTDMHNNPFIEYITFEEIFIHERRNFIQAVAHATGFTEDTYTGIEIDLDCIENVLSSAASPAGITVLQARQYINFTATDAKAAYLHLCEGAVQLKDGRKDDSTGKLISTLVCDFVKAHAQTQR